MLSTASGRAPSSREPLPVVPESLALNHLRDLLKKKKKKYVCVRVCVRVWPELELGGARPWNLIFNQFPPGDSNNEV